MLTKPPNNKNQSTAINPVSSPKDVQKFTKETTSGDESISQKLQPV